ncbi:MAG: hypothetical protein II117_08305 [Clostridia bacterium]|nr:hypothetical protein [Clostridia bacterium]
MSKTFDCYICTKADLCDAVKRFGIMPLFENSVPGFSVEEHVAPKAWFTDDEGVWEWKGPVIRETGCAYGKFFGHKAVFISPEWYPDFVNYRRGGYDFEGWYEDGLVSHDEKIIYDAIRASGCIPSKLLKRMLNYRKGGNRGFDGAINRLQANGYVLIDDFMYEQDRFGRTYGWGVAVYTTPEQRFGENFLVPIGNRTPQESRARIFTHLMELLPDADPRRIDRYLQ